MKVADNDPTTLVLHQSDIKHFMTCPDQFRVVNGIMPGGTFDQSPDMRLETDAATVGTVFHAVVEHDLGVEHFKSDEAAMSFATVMLAKTIQQYVQDGIRYSTESFGDDPKKAIATLQFLVKMWYHSVERQHWLTAMREHPELITFEWSFEVPFITNRDGRYRNIRLGGQADVLDRYDMRLVDWKTASQEYKRWEKSRWDVQSTTYTYAAAQDKLILPHETGYQFDFKVFNHRNKKETEPQTVTVWRDQNEWAWLVQMVSNMVAMIESDLAAWPLRDDHALCSPRWCPVWSQCKGSLVGDVWR